MHRIYVPKKENKVGAQTILVGVIAFLFGVFATASIALNVKVASIDPHNDHSILSASSTCKNQAGTSKPQETTARGLTVESSRSQKDGPPLQVHSVLQNTRILVAIAAYDFSQIPHLEEVLDVYHDLCFAGAQTVDVVIHATVAYPVTLIDLWNTRFSCENFSLRIVLKPKSLRLHLVDCHRTLFYEKLQEYDLFIYTEDDIRVTPTTVATYLYETRRLAHSLQGHAIFKPSDFNVGVIRYEYNYPANVVIDDKTRHATQNVTRVYWEHSGCERPVVPNCMSQAELTPLRGKPMPDQAKDDPILDRYVTMKNHHQGMFLATRDLLTAWRDRGESCRFDTIRNRPGRGSQPTEGTQRVWMSSQMLYGGRHCHVSQIFPKDKFGALTVWHLPNKNYRRVGKYRNRTFSDGTEVFQQPHASLLTAMELHLGLRMAWPSKPQIPYKGITMVDEVDVQRDRSPMLDRRMTEYQQYVDRGGVLTEYDFTRTELVEESW